MLTKELATKIIEALENGFRKYNKCFDVYDNYCGICIDITWGDWKHEHWCADEITREVLAELGLNGKYTITTQVTEEDGSDCYSAIHVIRFAL